MTVRNGKRDGLDLLSRWLDDELGAGEAAEFDRLLADDPELRQARARLDRLCADVARLAPEPPGDAVLRVLAAADAERTLPLRFEPVRPAWTSRWPGAALGLGAMAAAAAAALWLNPEPATTPAAGDDAGLTSAVYPAARPVPVAATGQRRVQGSKAVEIRVQVPGARSVAVAGSFNGWDAASDPLRRAPDGSFAGTVHLDPGDYEYALVVDGREWRADPGASRYVSDGFGGENSVIEVR